MQARRKFPKKKPEKPLFFHGRRFKIVKKPAVPFLIFIIFEKIAWL
jgi:hypothetical protein